MSPDLFWRLTMRELHREFAAAQLRRDDRLEELTFQAFQTVRVWVLTKNKKKMPEFNALLGKSKAQSGGGSGRGRQSPEQLEAMMHMMAARFGTKVKNPRLGQSKGGHGQ